MRADVGAAASGAAATAGSETFLPMLGAGGSVTGRLAPGAGPARVAVTIEPAEHAVFEVKGAGDDPVGGFGLVLALRDGDGTLLRGEDGYGPDFARLGFLNTGSAPRQLWIEVAGFGPSDAGGYRLTRTALPAGAEPDVPALAIGLAGTGGGWATAVAGAIPVDLSRLDVDLALQVRAGLAAWTRATGLDFAEAVLDPAAPGGLLFEAGDAGRFTTLARDGQGRIGAAWITLDGRPGATTAADVLHEIGHGIGLSDAGGAAQAGRATVMAGGAAGTDVPALTPLAADLAAVALLHGPGTPRAPGDTTYGPGGTGGALDDLAARLAQGRALLVDGGGVDHLDLSGQAGPQRIDLAPGAVSDVSGGTANLGIADDTVIENVTGGAGDDRIAGNAAANRIDGGGGDDLLAGGAGADMFVFRRGGGGDLVLDFEPGVDRVLLADADVAQVRIDPAAGGVALLAEDGTRMTLSGVAATALAGDSFVWADGRAAVFGTDDDDLLAGGSGSDALFGGPGADRLRISSGADTLDGGTGSDWALAPHAVPVRLDLARTGPQPVPGGQVTLRSIENLMGGSGGDRLSGNDRPNVLMGVRGFDTLDGGGGADTLVGGTGRDLLYGGRDRSRDVFRFDSIYDSKPGARRDILFDILPGTDDIDVSGIDANVFKRGDQAFFYSGTRPAAHALWIHDAGRNLLIRGDVNGDRRFDFEIEVVDVGLLTLKDIIL